MEAFLTEILERPYYGIYRFGEGLDIEDIKYLGKPTPNSPKIIGYGQIDDYFEDISDEEFERECDLLQGLLPIGSQGCTYETMIVVNGEHKGKVVYIDLENYTFKFAYENNFLDWYERWLDEILLGYLSDGPTWFGYLMGGTDTELIERLKNAENEDYKLACLNGILKVPTIKSETIDFLENLCRSTTGALKLASILLLTKYDYSKAKPILKSFFDTNPFDVFQFVWWYSKENSDDWIEEIKCILSQTTEIDGELFRICTYVLLECNTNLKNLLEPYRNHSNSQIKQQAEFIIGRLEPRKKKLEPRKLEPRKKNPRIGKLKNWIKRHWAR